MKITFDLENTDEGMTLEFGIWQIYLTEGRHGYVVCSEGSHFCYIPIINVHHIGAAIDVEPWEIGLPDGWEDHLTVPVELY